MYALEGWLKFACLTNRLYESFAHRCPQGENKAMEFACWASEGNFYCQTFNELYTRATWADLNAEPATIMVIM